MRWHKGWTILIFIVLTVLACLGFGRFSLGAIVPFMKDGLNLDYKETGLIASSVFFGYLISVTVIGHFVIRYGAKRVITVSLLIIAAGMLISAKAIGFWTAFIGCFFTGVGTGGAYIPALGLVAQWFAPNKKGMAMGTAMGGAGLGIVFSGFVVPMIVNINQQDGWRISWVTLAVLVILIAILTQIFIKNKPEDVGLLPIGANKMPEKPTKPKQDKPDVKENKWEVYKNKLIWMMGLIYLCWGFSYIVFSTFLVDYLMKDIGLDKGLAGMLFSIAGIASIISGFIWGSVSDRLGRMYALTVVYMTQAAMLLALSFSTGVTIIVIEILIYGVTLWGVPAVMNASVGDFIRMKYVPIAMGFITLFFSIGQFISPVVTGYLIDLTGNYFGAFILSAGLNLIGGIGCLALHVIQKNKLKVNKEQVSAL